MDKIYHNNKFYSEEEIRTIIHEYYEKVFSNKNDRHVKMQKLFPKDLGKDAKILDYGCGMGGISQLFNDIYKCQVDGVDISENELKKAEIGFSENKDLNFILLENFSFPDNHYDMVFSSQVIEHIHNPGNYLAKINKMLKDDKYLIIGLPNIVNLNFLINLLFFTKNRMQKHADNMSKNYNKASHHINGWDPVHFITLAASCGFEFVDYLPTEGTPISGVLNKIPFIGKYIYKIPLQTRLSYTMFFIFKKSKDVHIGNSD